MRRGKNTSAVEVTNVSANGFWLLIEGAESFVAFEHFPWFRDASIGQLLNVERPAGHHLYWPELDVDLAVDSLSHPERYPLVSRARPRETRQRRVTPATTLAEGRASRPKRSRS